MKMTLLVCFGFIGMLSFASVGNAGTFKCRCLDSGEDLNVIFHSNGQIISAETGSETSDFNKEAYLGDLDLKYRPKTSGSLRYIVRNSGFDKTRIIIDGSMAQGLAGKMRIEGNTDSYWSRRYKCQ